MYIAGRVTSLLPEGIRMADLSETLSKMPDSFQLSESTRDKLFSFIEQHDQIFSDGGFERDD